MKKKKILKILEADGRYSSPNNKKLSITSLYTTEEVLDGIKGDHKVIPHEWAVCERLFHHDIGFLDLPIRDMYFTTPEQAVDAYMKLVAESSECE